MQRHTQFLRWFGFLVLAWAVPPARAVHTEETTPSKTRVVRVGVLTDNYPYSFRDTDGKIKGFVYDLAVGVEEAMGLKLDRVIGTTEEIRAAFRDGRVDLLQSYAQFPEREGEAAFTVPYMTLAGTIIVREGEQDIRSFEDLRARKVLVHRGSLGEAVLRRAGMGGSIVYADSVGQTLIRLAQGEADATMASRLSAVALAQRNGIKGLVPLDVKIPGYEVRYCMAVRNGDHELLAQVNEGLAIMVRTGRFDEIYRKWFGHLEPGKYSAEQVLWAVAAGLAIALAVAIAAAIQQRHLRQRIMQQAEALRTSEERSRALFTGHREGLLVLLSVAGRLVVQQANPAARRLFGLPEDFAGGLSLSALVAEDPEFARRMEAASAQGTTEFEYECPDGAGSWRIMISAIGERTLVTVSDITESVAARHRLQLQEEQLRQKQKLEAVGTLARGVAHDFNNLLTAIMGNTELSLMGLPPDHPEAPGLRVALNAARRARELVKQILTFSRQSAPRREVVALRPLVEDTVNLLRSLAKESVAFEINLPADLPSVHADPAQVHQVLMNLGTNAVQAMRGRPGRLSFTAEAVQVGPELREQQVELRPGYYVRLSVQDTGPGMTEEVRRRVFEPFFTTKAPGEGTGLGLSVVHGIMEQHAGAVTLYTHPGRGAHFHLYFVAGSPAHSSLVEAEAGPGLGRGESILFVDDDAAVVDTGRKMLERLGYRVSAHPEATSALAAYRAQPAGFDLVFSDLTMPGMNGLQLLAAVREIRASQPFVLCSGIFSESDRVEAATQGVSVLLPKPLNLAVLNEAVSTALRQK